MPILTKQQQKTTVSSTRKSTLGLHSAAVAMASARSVTSHARHVYHRRYKGRYRFAEWIFAFDAFLMGIVAVLLVFDAALFLQSFIPKDGGLSVNFSAPILRTADEVPISVTLRSKDGLSHEDVRLQWHIPEWVEIVRAEPPLAQDGSIFLGRISPGVDHRSLLVVRVRALQGITVPFQIAIQQTDRWGLRQSIGGTEVRTIESSVVSAGMPVYITSAVSGGSIPVLIQNSGKHQIRATTLRITDGPGTIAGATSIYLGSLAPSSTRVVLIDLPEMSNASVALAWQLEDAARIIAASSGNIAVHSTVDPTLTKGTSLGILQHSNGGTSQAYFSLDGTRDVKKYFSPSLIASSTYWTVLPLRQTRDGEWDSGKKILQSFTSNIPFTAEARYYSSSGDQIGVGPLQPQVGQATRYWIVWSVDPGPTGLRDVVLQGALPADVRATGQFASVASGEFVQDENGITWSVPSLTPTAGQGPVTFAFEVEMLPQSVASSVVFMATSTVRGVDAQSGVARSTDIPDVRILR